MRTWMHACFDVGVSDLADTMPIPAVHTPLDTAVRDRFWVWLGRVVGSGRKPWHSISVSLVCGLLMALDAAVIALAGMLTLLADAARAYASGMATAYLGICLAGSAGAVLLAHAAKLYEAETIDTPFLKPWHAIGCWLATLLVLLGAVFFLHADSLVPRGWIGLWFAMGAAGLGLGRIMLRAKIAWWRSGGWMRRRVLVVGNRHMVAELTDRLAQPALREVYQIVGTLNADEAGTIQGSPDEGGPDMAQEAILSFVRATSAETVMIGFGSQPGRNADRIGRALADMPIEVVLCPEASLLAMPVIQARQVGGLSLLQVSRPPLGDWARLAKGLEDRLISALALLFFAPVMLLAAAAIRLETPGPALFRQQRFGFNNQPISVLKFRSMYASLGDPTGAQRTVRGDPRVTRVGRFIRRTSIDELPQLINVLRGEMSMVGPRAHPLKMTVGGELYHEAVAGYAARHRVKPGITGLAQINGCRGEIKTIEQAQARIRYDLEYVSRWSIWLDVKIMLLTPFKAFHKAY